MKLFGSYTSPFVRKCRITAMECGVADRLSFVETVVLNDHADHPNPLNMVPSLVDDSGDMFVDSRVICDYLASLGSSLPNASDWNDRRLVAMADGLMDRAVAMALEARRPVEQQSPDWQARRRKAIFDTLSTLNDRVPKAFSAGAIALVCALGYLDFRHSSLNWREAHPALADWFKTLSQRDSVLATEPPS